MENNKPSLFLDYDKISDILLWFGNQEKYQLKFNVVLKKKDINGNKKSFHSEFSYFDKDGEQCFNIKREYRYFFTIEKYNGAFEDKIVLKPNDVEILKILIKDTIYPWFIGSKNVYGIDQDNKLRIIRNVKPCQFAVSAVSYINFKPIVYYFDNTTEQAKQGIRLEINDPENYVDIPVDTFFHISSILLNTDMLNASMNMLNYVKSKPYGINIVDLNNKGPAKPSYNTSNGFFNKK